MAKDKKKIEDLLGEDEIGLDEQENPEEATPDGGEENPLKKMDEISKAKPGKNKGESKTLDNDVIEEMFKTGENTEGMFTPNEEEEHEEEDDDAKIKVGSSVEPSEKYKQNFKNDMFKHPDEYKVVTPRGEMTVAEAIRAGYNPITKRFDKKHGQDQLKEKHLSQLNDADRAAIEDLTNPTAAQIAPADAEMYGVPAGSPMIRGNQNPMEQMTPEANGMQGQMPIGGAMPGAEESQAANGVNPDALASLLGGAQ